MYRGRCRAPGSGYGPGDTRPGGGWAAWSFSHCCCICCCWRSPSSGPGRRSRRTLRSRLRLRWSLSRRNRGGARFRSLGRRRSRPPPGPNRAVPDLLPRARPRPVRGSRVRLRHRQCLRPLRRGLPFPHLSRHRPSRHHLLPRPRSRSSRCRLLRPSPLLRSLPSLLNGVRCKFHRRSRPSLRRSNPLNPFRESCLRPNPCRPSSSRSRPRRKRHRQSRRLRRCRFRLLRPRRRGRCPRTASRHPRDRQRHRPGPHLDRAFRPRWHSPSAVAGLVPAIHAGHRHRNRWGRPGRRRGPCPSAILPA